MAKHILAAIALLALASHGGADDRPAATVEELTPGYVKNEKIGGVSVAVTQNDGTTKEVPVSLQLARYEVRIRRDGDVQPASRIYCWRLKSSDEGSSYAWHLWWHGALGNFQLVPHKGGSRYLAWVGASLLFFADVSKPNDESRRLNSYVSRAETQDIVTVPVDRLVPNALRWGRNAHYSDITVLSISKDPSGQWTVKITDPKKENVYTIVSDPTAEIGWRLCRS